jgi:hypothetical protein
MHQLEKKAGSLTDPESATLRGEQMTLPKTYIQNVHDAMTAEEAAIDIVNAQVADGTCPEDYADFRIIQFTHDITFTRASQARRDKEI